MTRLLLGLIWFCFVGIRDVDPTPKPKRKVVVLQHLIEEGTSPGFGYGVYSYAYVCIDDSLTTLMRVWRPQNGSPDTTFPWIQQHPR
jgi:hypothetical protein